MRKVSLGILPVLRIEADATKINDPREHTVFNEDVRCVEIRVREVDVVGMRPRAILLNYVLVEVGLRVKRAGHLRVAEPVIENRPAIRIAYSSFIAISNFPELFDTGANIFGKLRPLSVGHEGDAFEESDPWQTRHNQVVVIIMNDVIEQFWGWDIRELLDKL